MVKTIITIVFVLVSIALAVIVLKQEGKGQGLSGALGGSNETYWGKNKGRSKDAVIQKVTVVLAVLFCLLALLLDSKFI